MISHQHRCIFIHQRKAAGCSIITSFGLTPEEADWHLFNDGTQSAEWARREELAPGYLVFTVMRNPWDRFVSAWKYLATTRRRSLLDVLQNLPSAGHDYRHLTRPQLDILVDGPGTVVPDYVLRFEHLADDYARLCRIIGKALQRLPRLNVTRHEGYQQYFGPDTRALFDRHFRHDIEILGYEYSGAANPSRLGAKVFGP